MAAIRTPPGRGSPARTNHTRQPSVTPARSTPEAPMIENQPYSRSVGASGVVVSRAASASAARKGESCAGSPGGAATGSGAERASLSMRISEEAGAAAAGKGVTGARSARNCASCSNRPATICWRSRQSFSDLPPLTGFTCLVREAGHEGPWKDGVRRWRGSVFGRTDHQSCTGSRSACGQWPDGRRGLSSHRRVGTELLPMAPGVRRPETGPGPAPEGSRARERDAFAERLPI